MESAEKPDTSARDQILQAAYAEIYRHGFQAASLNNILANTSLTKGALYHHFPNKTALGYAVVEEIIQTRLLDYWLRPVEDADDPLGALIQLLTQAGDTMTMEDVTLGCPLNNLSQEMSPIDEGFRQRINHVFTLWRAGFTKALARGQANAKIRVDIHPAETATFIIATMEGCVGMAKNAQDPELLFTCAKKLMDYLESLRP
jgi:AcrR family transcriptional regulator